MERNENGQFVSVEKTEVECPQCGDVSEFHPSDAQRGRRFCSQSCANKHKSENWTGENHHNYKRQTSVCEYCGDEFDHLPSKNRQYCDGSCRNKDREYPTGKANPNWKGGRTSTVKKLRNSDKYDEWRKEVFERDKYTCQDCGSSDKFLTAHHKVPIKENLILIYDVENGITLCTECHQDRHPDLNLNLFQSEQNGTLD